MKTLINKIGLAFLTLALLSFTTLAGCAHNNEKVREHTGKVAPEQLKIDSIFLTLPNTKAVFSDKNHVTITFDAGDKLYGSYNQNLWIFNDGKNWWSIITTKDKGLELFNAGSETALLKAVNQNIGGYTFYDGKNAVADTTDELKQAFRRQIVLNGVIHLKGKNYLSPPQDVNREVRCIGETGSSATACAEAQMLIDCRDHGGVRDDSGTYGGNPNGGGYLALITYTCRNDK